MVVMPDRARYLQAPSVTDLAARDDRDFVTEPAYSPKRSPIQSAADTPGRSE